MSLGIFRKRQTESFRMRKVINVFGEMGEPTSAGVIASFQFMVLGHQSVYIE
jgi:hypothetical protein